MQKSNKPRNKIKNNFLVHPESFANIMIRTAFSELRVNIIKDKFRMSLPNIKIAALSEIDETCPYGARVFEYESNKRKAFILFHDDINEKIVESISKSFSLSMRKTLLESEHQTRSNMTEFTVDSQLLKGKGNVIFYPYELYIKDEKPQIFIVVMSMKYFAD